MPKLVRVATIAAALCLAAACSKPPAPVTAAPAGPNYEIVTIPGSPTVSAMVIRINVATGQAALGGSAPSQMNPIPDLTLPAGQYHITSWSSPNTDGSMTFGVTRFDKVSGRIWLLAGSGQTWNWNEMTPPK